MIVVRIYLILLLINDFYFLFTDPLFKPGVDIILRKKRGRKGEYNFLILFTITALKVNKRNSCNFVIIVEMCRASMVETIWHSIHNETEEKWKGILEGWYIVNKWISLHFFISQVVQEKVENPQQESRKQSSRWCKGCRSCRCCTCRTTCESGQWHWEGRR